ncbi:unnamed protein product, partial [Hapterophycus canaliculatus]
GDGRPRYWGDDVVLTVTNTGSVVVTIGGHIVIEKHDPRRDISAGGWMTKLLRKVDPVRIARDAVRRRRHRCDLNNEDNNTGDGTDDFIISNEYSLHVVENGFEVFLE